MGSSSELTGFLVGQPWWVDLIAVFIFASAYVVTRLVKRSGDTGNGRQALDQADAARDILADVALDEREKRQHAEQEGRDVRSALGLEPDTSSELVVAAARALRFIDAPIDLRKKQQTNDESSEPPSAQQ